MVNWHDHTTPLVILVRKPGQLFGSKSSLHKRGLLDEFPLHQTTKPLCMAFAAAGRRGAITVQTPTFCFMTNEAACDARASE